MAGLCGRKSARAMRHSRHPKPQRHEPAHDAQAHIAKRNSRLPPPDKKYLANAKGGKRLKPAGHAGHQKDPRIGGEPLLPLDEPSDDSRDQAAKYIHHKRAERKSPIGRMMQHQAAKLVTTDGAQTAAKANQQELLHAVKLLRQKGAAAP